MFWPVNNNEITETITILHNNIAVELDDIHIISANTMKDIDNPILGHIINMCFNEGKIIHLRLVSSFLIDFPTTPPPACFYDSPCLGAVGLHRNSFG